jgi:hypothetical protein
MLFPTKRKQTNPYGFIRMEKWGSNTSDLKVYVGYCENGDIYLTGDVRELPIFSTSNKLGEDTITVEAFEIMKEFYSNEELTTCEYEVINLKGKFQFNIERKPEVKYDRETGNSTIHVFGRLAIQKR